MFSHEIDRALEVASTAHSGQYRKNSDGVHYFTHPVHVALILARAGLDEICIQAAILHDVVEDCEDWTLERIEIEFGIQVRVVVADLSEDKSKTWEERKAWAVEHVPHMNERSVAVKAADKLHNLSCLLRDLQAASDPEEVWAKFRGGRERTLAMSTELVEALSRRLDADLSNALGKVMRDLRSHG